MADLEGIDPNVITHQQNVDIEARPIKQKKHVIGSECNHIIKEDVERLLQVEYIWPVLYPGWLANVVLVPKSNGNWRLCVDSDDLNKACPKDSYPEPIIEMLINSTSGCEIMSFLDAFQGYNQIMVGRARKD